MKHSENVSIIFILKSFSLSKGFKQKEIAMKFVNSCFFNYWFFYKKFTNIFSILFVLYLNSSNFISHCISWCFSKAKIDILQTTTQEEAPINENNQEINENNQEEIIPNTFKFTAKMLKAGETKYPRVQFTLKICNENGDVSRFIYEVQIPIEQLGTAFLEYSLLKKILFLLRAGGGVHASNQREVYVGLAYVLAGTALSAHFLSVVIKAFNNSARDGSNDGLIITAGSEGKPFEFSSVYQFFKNERHLRTRSTTDSNPTEEENQAGNYQTIENQAGSSQTLENNQPDNDFYDLMCRISGDPTCLENLDLVNAIKSGIERTLSTIGDQLTPENLLPHTVGKIRIKEKFKQVEKDFDSTFDEWLTPKYSPTDRASTSIWDTSGSFEISSPFENFNSEFTNALIHFLDSFCFVLIVITFFSLWHISTFGFSQLDNWLPKLPFFKRAAKHYNDLEKKDPAQLKNLRLILLHVSFYTSIFLIALLLYLRFSIKSPF